MLNPYSVPDLQAVRWERAQQWEAARQAVRGPAIALICVASLGLLTTVLCLGFDMLLLLSGAVNQFENPELKQIQIGVRSVLGLVGAANCGFLIWAGISMQRLQQHQLCWFAGILACIPAISPCCCLGIPFGVWAITVLNRSDVADAFD